MLDECASKRLSAPLPALGEVDGHPPRLAIGRKVSRCTSIRVGYPHSGKMSHFEQFHRGTRRIVLRKITDSVRRRSEGSPCLKSCNSRVLRSFSIQRLSKSFPWHMTILGRRFSGSEFAKPADADAIREEIAKHIIDMAGAVKWTNADSAKRLQTQRRGYRIPRRELQILDGAAVLTAPGLFRTL